MPTTLTCVCEKFFVCILFLFLSLFHMMSSSVCVKKCSLLILCLFFSVISISFKNFHLARYKIRDNAQKTSLFQLSLKQEATWTLVKHNFKRAFIGFSYKNFFYPSPIDLSLFFINCFYFHFTIPTAFEQYQFSPNGFTNYQGIVT